MSRIHDIQAVTLGSTVSIGGTFTVAYPAGKAAADYRGGTNGFIVGMASSALQQRDGDYSIAFGASNATVTVLRGRGFSAGEIVYVHLDRATADANEERIMANPFRMGIITPVKINLGAPVVASANAIVLSQGATTGGLATGINGALAAGGVATLNPPRALVAAWTNTAIVTVTGTDEFGVVMRESSASGTSFAGRKAFARVTGISVNATVTGLTVGTSNILGLPVFLQNANLIFRELQDDATATAGTVVVGDSTTPTATTGDVRGTYLPNATPNGTIRFDLIALLANTEFRGLPQF